MVRKFDPPPKKDFLTPLLLLAAALLVRLLYLWQIKEIPFFSQPIIDPLEYDRMARTLLTAKEAFRSTAFYQAPGYAYFLAIIYKIFGGSTGIAHVIQVMFGAVNVVLLYFLGKTLFNKTVGIISGLILAFYGPVIFYEGDFYREPLLAVGFVVLFIVLWSVREKTSLKAWFGAGIAFALTVSIRENMLLFIPFLFLLIVLRRKQINWFKVGVVFFIPLLALVAFVSHKNVQATGERIFVASQSGLGFYIGNHSQMDHWTTLQPGIEYDRLSKLPLLRAGIIKSKDASRWYYGRALKFVKENPVQWMKIVFKKIMLFWGSYEFMPNEGLEYYREESFVMRFLTFRLGSFSFPFGLLCPLALVGLLMAYKEHKEEAIWIGGIILIYMASFLIFHVRARFRIPIIPFFALLGALGAVRLVELIRAKSIPNLIRPVGIFLAALVFLNAPYYDFSYAERFPKNYFLAKSFHSVEKYKLALPLYLAAIEDGMSLAEVHNDLAILYQNQGRKKDAIRELEKSIALEPDYDKMRVTLGILYAETGSEGKARAQFRKSVEINPYNPFGHLNLGITLEESHKKEAENEYNTVLELSKIFPMMDIEVIRSAKDGLWRLGRTDLSDAQVIPEKQKWAMVKIEKEKSRAVIKKADLHSRKGRIAASNAYSDLGVAYLRAGDLKKAEKNLLKSLEISYKQTPAHTNLGIVYGKMGDRELALKHYNEALSLVPDNYVVINNLGRIYEKQGNDARAMQYYRRALALSPNNKVIMKNIARLNKIRRR